MCHHTHFWLKEKRNQQNTCPLGIKLRSPRLQDKPFTKYTVSPDPYLNFIDVPQVVSLPELGERKQFPEAQWKPFSPWVEFRK